MFSSAFQHSRFLQGGAIVTGLGRASIWRGGCRRQPPCGPDEEQGSGGATAAGVNRYLNDQLAQLEKMHTQVGSTQYLFAANELARSQVVDGKQSGVYHARMRTSDFDYELPEELIAQEAVGRGESSLLVLDRSTGKTLHLGFRSILEWIRPDDLLLLNDTEVIPARMHARRSTGRRFEIFLLREGVEGSWEALLRPSSRAHRGERLLMEDGGSVQLLRPFGEGIWELKFSEPMDRERMQKVGEAPLPPYIRRPEGATEADRQRYQTVYASNPGAVAAPTAGLHFDQELLDTLANSGTEITRVTLHVGMGTFRPVAVEEIDEHEMHEEHYGFSEENAEALNSALREGRRIVCVGTTSVRALEDALQKGDGRVEPGWTSTRIFIFPGYQFRGTGALLTNFHLPKSTLLMLVSALAGREKILEAYREAVRRRYRFFSYGDAMLIV